MKQQFIDSLPENQRKNIRPNQKQRSTSNPKNAIKNKSPENVQDTEKTTNLNAKEISSDFGNVYYKTLSELYEHKL